LAAAAFSMALAAGCATPAPKVVDFSETRRDYRSKDYPDVYSRWTRHDVARRDVDAALEVWATFKSWDFREAYIEHYAAIYSLSDAEREALRGVQHESFRAAFEFHLAVQSTTYKWNDLEKKSSAWRLTLVDALGHELAPEYVKLEKLPEPYELEFFPAKTPFTRSYAVRFSRPAEGKAGDFVVEGRSGSLLLRIASPLGRVELPWQGG
jgi:hypothetical protein